MDGTSGVAQQAPHAFLAGSQHGESRSVKLEVSEGRAIAVLLVKMRRLWLDRIFDHSFFSSAQISPLCSRRTSLDR